MSEVTKQAPVESLSAGNSLKFVNAISSVNVKQGKPSAN